MPLFPIAQGIRCWLRCAAASALLACVVAQAAPVAVPDAQDWARLTPAERQARKAEIRRQLDQASPAERRELLRQRREMLRRLSPEERAALRDRLPPR